MIKQPQRDARWRSVKLGEVIQIKHGFAFQGQFFAEAGPYVLLTPGNFEEGGGFRLRGSKEKYYVGEVDRGYVLNKGDLIVVMTEQAEGLLGSSALIPESGRFLHNQRLGLVIPLRISEVDRRFLYHLFNYRAVRAQIRASASGVKVRHTSPSRISEVTVKLPSLEIQRRIADILCCYEDLIENNRRRIQILEEVARAIYREWFVEFRAPGVKLRKASANEVALTGRTTFPEEWVVRPMEDVSDVVDCLHSKKPAEYPSGSKMLLQLFNIGEAGKFDIAKRYLISDADYREWTSRIEVRAGDCIITNVGRVGAVAQIPQGVLAALGRNMTAVRPRPGLISPPYLLEYLLSSYMATETARKKDMGTIMDALNVKGIVRLGVPVPSTAVLEAFDGIVEPIHNRIQVCVRQNLNLGSTRDMLLQRLMSGGVIVDDVDIAPANHSMQQVGEVSR